MAWGSLGSYSSGFRPVGAHSGRIMVAAFFANELVNPFCDNHEATAVLSGWVDLSERSAFAQNL